MAYPKDPNAVRPPVGEHIPLSDTKRRIGQAHGRAKLTDHDVELILGLLEARDALIEQYEANTPLTRGEIQRALHAAQLSYAGIAAKFEISKSHVRWLAIGHLRGQAAARWKRVHLAAA